MGIILNAGQSTAIKKSWSLFGFIRDHWYLAVLLVIILPSIIGSIHTAFQTQNPLYPVFDLAQRLFTADAVLQKDVNTLTTNPDLLVGMAHPDHGMWKTVVYYWMFFWNVIWNMIGNVWLIFFPFVVIFKLMNLRNTSEPLKTFIYSSIIFLVFLLITNTIIMIHGIVAGNTFITLPADKDTFGQYYFLFKQMLPFHGLFALGKYLVLLISA